jgi:WD40 repeat protein
MRRNVNTKKLFIGLLLCNTFIFSMEEGYHSILFVRTNDNHITPVNRKNISHMRVLDVMNAHQHKDFACISEEKKNINNYQNPLDASALTRLTSINLQLLDKASDKSKNKETFYSFYSSLKRDEQIMLFDAAIQVQSSKLISLLGLPLLQEIQKNIISYIMPQVPSVVAVKKALLKQISPMISVLEGHEKFCGKVAWNPDNSIMVSTSGRSDKLIVRNSQTGKPIRVFDQEKYIKNILFSPDGTRLLYTTLLDDSVVYLCDGHMGDPMHMLTGEKMIYSPDSKIVVTCGEYNHRDHKVPIMIYDAKNGDLLQATGHSAPINNFAFAPDSQHFVSVGKGYEEEHIILWNTKGEKIKFLEGHDGNAMLHAAFSPDHSRLVTGSHSFCSNENLIFRNGKTGDKIKDLMGHGSYKIDILLFSPDNHYLLSGAQDSVCGQSKFIIWDAKDGFYIKKIKKYVTFSFDLVAFTPDSAFLIICDTVYDMSTFEPIVTLRNPQLEDDLGLESRARGIALSPDGNRIAAVQDDKLVLYTLICDKILDIINAVQSGKSDLFQIYLFKKLCNKFGVKKENKYTYTGSSGDSSGNFSA